MCVCGILAIQLNLPLTSLPPNANIPMQLESFGFLYPLLIMPRLEYHFVQPKTSVVSVIWPSLCWWHEHKDYGVGQTPANPSLRLVPALPVYHQFYQKIAGCIFFNARCGTSSTIRNKLSNSSWEWPKSLLTSGLKQKR